ncbi:carboxypeptidase y inhibitor [Diaporthe amygdali]|uniref:carboxypeptidase y inhibitor n=1 Tax=Phomopsis amygdali TaxID=1214568 RepID=UPI0022FE1EC0|nr:carboxypeptidase y inhibitor [Diaporthe amygdali]KAJ0118023.1 carboxypeptidase y inhibitor [Diaporthe amygdali]
MLQITSLLALAAVQLLGSATAVSTEETQHVLVDFNGGSAEDLYQVKEELKKAEIIPSVIDDFLPSLLVGAEWPSSKQAELGNTIKPKKLQDEPTITLTRPKSAAGPCSSVANITYTVTLTDPDAPSREDPKWSEMCHWIATGLATSDDEDSSCSSSLTLSLSDLKELMPYYPPGPPEKTGKHRYVLFVFAPANGTTDPLHLKKPEDRRHWGYEFDGDRVGVRKWSRENGLVPVAANFVYSQNKKQ